MYVSRSKARAANRIWRWWCRCRTPNIHDAITGERVVRPLFYHRDQSGFVTVMGGEALSSYLRTTGCFFNPMTRSEITQDDVRLLDFVCRKVKGYVPIAPMMAQLMEKRLASARASGIVSFFDSEIGTIVDEAMNVAEAAVWANGEFLTRLQIADFYSAIFACLTTMKSVDHCAVSQSASVSVKRMREALRNPRFSSLYVYTFLGLFVRCASECGVDLIDCSQ